MKPHERLLTYQWPGNVRELKNVAERLVIRQCGGEIGVEDLPGELRVTRTPTTGRAVGGRRADARRSVD